MAQNGEFDNSGHFTGDMEAFLAMSDDEISPEVPIKEEMVAEVMQELWKEISSCYTDKSYYSDPSLSPPIFPAASAWSSSVVVGCDVEKCGPAFSHSASTVMAGIQVGGVGLVGPTSGGEVAVGVEVSWIRNGGNRPRVVEEKGCFRGNGGEEGGKQMEGSDDGEEDEDDDQWLRRVLSWTPQELDEWT